MFSKKFDKISLGQKRGNIIFLLYRFWGRDLIINLTVMKFNKIFFEQKHLADLLLDLGATGAALDLFERLELWEDAIKCYQRLGKMEKVNLHKINLESNKITHNKGPKNIIVFLMLED